MFTDSDTGTRHRNEDKRITDTGKFICKANAEQNYRLCSVSNRYCKPETMVLMKIYRSGWTEVYVSSKVAENHGFNCADCNGLYEHFSSRVLQDQSRICQECDAENYFECSYCGNYRRIEERSESRGVCNSCVETMVGSPYKWCPGVHGHRADILSVCDVADLPPKKLLFGIEIEQEYKARTRTLFRETVSKIYKCFPDNTVIIKHDGSLSCGAELVTIPATPRAHLIYFRDFFDKLKDDLGVFGNQTGMHVHISSSALSTLHRGKILVFMNHPDNRDFICDVSGRSNPEYARFEDVRVSDIVRREGASRYVALNTTKNTLEFRCFKSPKSYKTFAYRLEFVEAVVDFTRKSSHRKLLFTDFIEWVMKTKTYPHLRKFLGDSY